MKKTSMLLVLAIGGCSTPETNESAAVTWYRDVLPVAQERCMGCHNDEAPTFSMERWSDALASRAASMAHFTEARVMPPWKPSPECNSYRDERRLTEEEIALFAAWSAAGAVPGDPADAPPPIAPRAGLARVDVSVALQEPYLPSPPEGEVDDLHCFVLDPNLTADRYMTGFDIRPGERRVVHHALLYIAQADEADALDAAEPGQGYGCFGGPGASSSTVIAGWVPGMPPSNYPEGTAIPLAAGSRLILQIHYNTRQAGPLADRSTVDLQLADAAPERPARIIPLANHDFEIPPSTDGYSASVEGDVPVAARLWAAAPHMHRFGRRGLAEIDHADGSHSCAVDIPDWDFDWQQFYFLQQPIDLAPGDRVRFECTWDNTSDASIHWGEGTGDEMCIGYFYVTL
jgi:hypothetical protein